MDTINFEADAGIPDAPSSDSLKRLASMVAQLRDEQMENSRIDIELFECESRIRKLAEEEIPELMRECGLAELKLADGAKVQVVDDIDCGISEERRAAAHAWLREHNLDGIIKSVLAISFGRGEFKQMSDLAARLQEEGLPVIAVESVHFQTLKATLKEQRAEGVAVPEELFALRPTSKAKVTPPPGMKPPPKPRKRK